MRVALRAGTRFRPGSSDHEEANSWRAAKHDNFARQQQPGSTGVAPNCRPTSVSCDLGTVAECAPSSERSACAGMPDASENILLPPKCGRGLPRRRQLSAPIGCDVVIVASRPGPRRGSGLLSPPAPRGFIVGPGQLPKGRGKRLVRYTRKAGVRAGHVFFVPRDAAIARLPATSSPRSTRLQPDPGWRRR